VTALLREGLRELGLDESRVETLERFAALLLKKNEVMNLTAITEPEAVAQLHLLDSAALTRFVDRCLRSSSRGIARRPSQAAAPARRAH